MLDIVRPVTKPADCDQFCGVNAGQEYCLRCAFPNDDDSADQVTEILLISGAPEIQVGIKPWHFQVTEILLISGAPEIQVGI